MLDLQYWLILLWLLGMPLIGYPMAKWSLRVWKYPGKYPIREVFLFPLLRFDRKMKVGKIECHTSSPRKHGHTGAVGLNRTVHFALEDDDAEVIAEYIYFTSLFWPLKFAWSLVIALPLFILVSVCFLILQPAKLLSRCKRCVTID